MPLLNPDEIFLRILILVGIILLIPALIFAAIFIYQTNKINKKIKLIILAIFLVVVSFFTANMLDSINCRTLENSKLQYSYICGLPIKSITYKQPINMATDMIINPSVINVDKIAVAENTAIFFVGYSVFTIVTLNLLAKKK